MIDLTPAADILHGNKTKLESMPEISVEAWSTDKNCYNTGDSNQVRLSVTLSNEGNRNLRISKARNVIHGYTNPEFFHSEDITGCINIDLSPGMNQEYIDILIWNIPPDAEEGAYGICMELYPEDGGVVYLNAGVFRVVSEDTLIVYNIAKQNYKGVDVFALNGGMSAEYAVEKSLEALSCGVSHSWYTLPVEKGHGPVPVYATREFLEMSVKQTVYYYDEYLGRDTCFDTVIISSGVLPMAYFSRTMKAPVLPLQYLVSANSIREIEAVADYSVNNGLSCYITLGYDASMKGIGVAWCELLDMPACYLEFIKRHKVKNILFVGTTGTASGETTARRVVRAGRKAGADIMPGDIYIMYPGTEMWIGDQPGNGLIESIGMLKECVADFDDIPLEEGYRHIGDWESGIEQEQFDNFKKTAERYIDGIRIFALQEEETGSLYRYASKLVLAFYDKNREFFGDGISRVKGIVLNPYIISHPFYETLKQYVPYVYWQFGSPELIAGVFVNRFLRDMIEEYCPQTDIHKLPVWLDSTENFGGFAAEGIKEALQGIGFEQIDLNEKKDGCYAIEAITGNGLRSPAELIHDELAGMIENGFDLKKWEAGLKPLTLEDIEKLAMSDRL